MLKKEGAATQDTKKPAQGAGKESLQRILVITAGTFYRPAKYSLFLFGIIPRHHAHGVMRAEQTVQVRLAGHGFQHVF
jgi:hypothetical protein